jgi:aminopeptidase N
VNKNQHNTINLVDYTVPEYLVDKIHLTFILHETETLVKARSSIRKNPQSTNKGNTIYLNGESIHLVSICIQGKELDKDRIKPVSNGLYIYDVPAFFDLDIITRISPKTNTSLTGLYLSSGNFCTQCEAEGFRRITYYPDRPDVLARFTTRIEADREKYPVLLSNGNLKQSGLFGNDRHFVEWEDPFPKPCYLFALVAGDLVCIEDTFMTGSGRNINLEIYVQAQNQNRCDHAMKSLKKAMKWDEEVFNLEYDLDRYMIVAVDDFNMGAMENKGLNIFNSKYVLASPETATDGDYMGIEGVIAHEYFHNWTGNRVTCRDWFQLSLKEGLTVFRDQEFSSDMNSRAVNRIKDVRTLRQFQFREDSGPMAHPVRPETYMEINNFYTVTIYNKGAELVRMIHTLVGADNFKRGMDLYFQRHDGQAVTCEDFVAAMSDASHVNLEQFKRWYSQAGTPCLSIEDFWDEATEEYKLTIEQHTSATPMQADKKPFHIPILSGFLAADTQSINSDYQRIGNNFLLELVENKQSFIFSGLKERPRVSLLRNFSAPVKLGSFYSRDDLTFLMANDDDLFNRCDAAFSLGASIILELAEDFKNNRTPQLPEPYVESVRKNLVDTELDKSLIALALTLPTESYLAQSMENVEPDFLHKSHQFVRMELARLLYNDFLNIYQQSNGLDIYQITPKEIGRRSLKNCCLSYLVSIAESGDETCKLCLQHYYNGQNMTDQVAALSSIAHHDIPERMELMSDFEKKWINEPLVMDKWFSIQALSSSEDTFSRVKELTSHPAFSIKNPNKVRSLIGAFSSNHYHFHQNDGTGYQFLTDNIIYLDSINPQIAARMVTPFTNWKRYDSARRTFMKGMLKSIRDQKPLSRDVFEIVNKSLNA